MRNAVSCPDDLVLKAVRHDLSPVERLRVDEHLRSCPECRAAVAVARAVGPLPRVSPDDESLAARLVNDVLAMPAPLEAVAPAKTRVRRWTVRVAWAAAAASLLIVSGAVIAAVSSWTRAARESRVQPHQSVVAAPAEPPAAVVDHPSKPTPSEDQPKRTPRPNRGDSSQPAAVASDAIPNAESAASLLRDALAARASGETERAASTFVLLQQRFSGTPEAVQSRYSLGDLYLQNGRALPAVQEFSAYLASSGPLPLAEEALLSLARARRMLGDTLGERATWQELLARFPRSQYAWRATRRLAELEQPTP